MAQNLVADPALVAEADRGAALDLGEVATQVLSTANVLGAGMAVLVFFTVHRELAPAIALFVFVVEPGPLGILCLSLGREIREGGFYHGETSLFLFFVPGAWTREAERPNYDRQRKPLQHQRDQN